MHVIKQVPLFVPQYIYYRGPQTLRGPIYVPQRYNHSELRALALSVTHKATMCFCYVLDERVH